MTIQLLTFDLDDTLWELEPTLVRAEQLSHQWLVERAGSALGDHTIESLRQRRFALTQSCPDEAHRVSALRINSLCEVLQEGGMQLTQSELLAREAFEIFLAARNEVELFASAEPVLRELKRHYRIGAITNGNADIHRIGLTHLFDFAINAEQLARAKPHPEPFELALQLGHCKANEAIHIGDHIDHDARAAMAIGMHTVWLNQRGTPWPGEDRPTAEIRDIGELPAVVALIASNSRER